ncbi:DUF2806 domain-containing protein [Rhizobium laguerreae]|uniref:DUF2806 domain-containing protein n=1 Tax=Rhizobium laguerreae TaxID=1076926 RepID=UPI001C90751B|nr:DUF2806 domain-containing protein [Rhizobium laguerreae]MBY3207046.1 DUF2806 domain-containing protein [Rhizobium laguerreae]
MPEDHLNNETSLSAELTETGVKAAANSRAIAAIDRLMGNVADLGNAWIEGVTTRMRARSEGERLIIEAAARYGIERIGQDQAFAERAFENHFRRVVSQQLNKDAVVAEALRDLRDQPPNEVEAISGPGSLSEEFLGRFESYSADASTEQLRERWGRILASEIRMPGNFSSKVMRIVDELDADTAALFERCVAYRSERVLVKPLLGDFPVLDRIALVSAGLLADPGIGGQSVTFAEQVLDGVECWVRRFGDIAIAVRKDVDFPRYAELALNGDRTPRCPVYILTDAGFALSSILTSREDDVGVEFALHLQSMMSSDGLSLWKRKYRDQDLFVKIPMPMPMPIKSVG